jgi:hypothetical protein
VSLASGRVVATILCEHVSLHYSPTHKYCSLAYLLSPIIASALHVYVSLCME